MVSVKKIIANTILAGVMLNFSAPLLYGVYELATCNPRKEILVPQEKSSMVSVNAFSSKNDGIYDMARIYSAGFPIGLNSYRPLSITESNLVNRL